MPALKDMPDIIFNEADLKTWGTIWNGTTGSIVKKTGITKPKNTCCFDKKQSMDFGATCIDPIVAKALATMLGDIPIREMKQQNGLLIPDPNEDCVELGETKVVGGVRTQNFDIAYRPDGIRIAYDSKTLNDADSIRKNWNNMINDLASEATTVHSRFPYALVLFFIVIPRPALQDNQAFDIIRTLERMNERENVQDENHRAESIALVTWDPDTGKVDNICPAQESSICLKYFSKRVQDRYVERYKGLPPHSRE